MNINKLRNLLKERKISQRELADLIEMSQPGLNNALKTGDFKVSVLEKIAKALDVPVTYFFDNVSGIVINGNGNKNNKQTIINSQSNEIESLKKQIKLLENTIKDKIEIINYLKNK